MKRPVWKLKISEGEDIICLILDEKLLKSFRDQINILLRKRKPKDKGFGIEFDFRAHLKITAQVEEVKGFLDGD